MAGDGILVPPGIPCHCHLRTPHHLLTRHLCPPIPRAAVRGGAEMPRDPLSWQGSRSHPAPAGCVPPLPGTAGHGEPGSRAGLSRARGRALPLRRVRARRLRGSPVRVHVALPVRRGRWARARGGGAVLPAPAPPPPREKALFRQLPGSSRAGSAGVRCQGNGDHLTHPPRYCSPASPEVPGRGEEEEEKAASLG